MLKSRLYELEIEKNEKRLNSIIGQKKNIEWGSQIRSYVFCPYTLVKDNRTNYEDSNVAEVMDGNINEFIYQYLEQEARNHVESLTLLILFSFCFTGFYGYFIK